MDSYARMLDKAKKPTPEIVDRYLGEESAARLKTLEAFLSEHYNLNRELRFPFGNNYGWGYKFSHGRKHLCYVFFEEGAFTVTFELGDRVAPQVEAAMPSMLPGTQQLWATRYPCGKEGGWLHYRVLSDDVLPDIYRLIEIKAHPPKKVK